MTEPGSTDPRGPDGPPGAPRPLPDRAPAAGGGPHPAGALRVPAPSPGIRPGLRHGNAPETSRRAPGDHADRWIQAELALPTPRRPRKPLEWTLVAGLSLLAISAALPLLFMAATAFRTQHDWDRAKIGLPTILSLGSFGRAWHGASIGVYFRNSLVVTLGTIVLTVLAATLAGFSCSKIQWRLRGPAYFFVLSWIAIPPLLLMVPIYVELVQLGLLDTYWSVILLYTALNLPFNVYLMAAFFRSLPDELIEAGTIDGASIHRIFAGILLPLARPALATLCIFNFLWAWNEFLFALLLLNSDSVKTLTVGVLALQGRFTTDYPALMAGLLITSLPVIGVYLVFQRHLVRAIAAGAVK